jgi:hypothetical protein
LDRALNPKPNSSGEVTKIFEQSPQTRQNIAAIRLLQAGNIEEKRNNIRHDTWPVLVSRCRWVIARLPLFVVFDAWYFRLAETILMQFSRYKWYSIECTGNSRSPIEILALPNGGDDTADRPPSISHEPNLTRALIRY